MMNLRTMVNGLSAHAVAERFMQYWEHDEATLKFWRASSNFVYCFNKGEKRYFLRFTFNQENAREQILAEIDYMQYLSEHGYPCVQAVPSNQGHIVETISTMDGLYVGVVFTNANGSVLELETMANEQFVEWGKSLASLHLLSQTYSPADWKRKQWHEVLDSIDHTLQRYPAERDAKSELDRIRLWLSELSFSENNFGLIHYDFQLDNVHWDEQEHHFHVFDFDDAMYHWFAMDIVTALKDVEDSNHHTASFLKGYRTLVALNEDVLELFPKFQRFDDIYTFSRLLLSLENSDIENPPTWYEGLKTKLTRICDEKRAGFRHPW